MRVCVLYNLDHDAPVPGRESREDVCRVAEAVGRALTAAGHRPSLLAVGDDPLHALGALRGSSAPDLVFNLCESVRGDARGEASMSAALQLLSLPFTGSDGLTLGLALDKDKAKALLRQRGISTPDWWVLERGAAPPDVEFPFPLIVKPLREDGSLGITFDSVVHDRAGLWAAACRVWALEQPALVEVYVEGREVMVSFLGNAPRQALPLREIAFGPAFDGRPRIVSYLAKWDPAAPECQDSASVACALPPDAASRVLHTALRTSEALGCRDYGRVDLRLSAAGVPYVIDVNPNCDLHPDAGFARAAAEAGLDYPALVSRIAEVALERTRRDTRDASDPAGGPAGAASAAAAGRHVQRG
jgi:D-alanine-D-alanine ligase